MPNLQTRQLYGKIELCSLVAVKRHIFYEMKVIKTNFKKNLKKSPRTPFAQRGLNVIAGYFKKGKVVIYPTDTIYGLGCIATNKKAIERIYRIKRRGKRKPFLILVSDFAMLKKYCYVSKEQEKYLHEIWRIKTLGVSKRRRVSNTRSITAILKSRGVLSRELTGGANSLAVRLPKNVFLIKIIKRVKAPIVSTSLNISGEKLLTNVKNLGRYFKIPRALLIKGAIELPDLVVDAGELKSRPSRIVDIREMGSIRVVRK